MSKYGVVQNEFERSAGVDKAKVSRFMTFDFRIGMFEGCRGFPHLAGEQSRQKVSRASTGCTTRKFIILRDHSMLTVQDLLSFACKGDSYFTVETRSV